MSLVNIASELDELSSQLIAFSEAIASARVQVESELQSSVDPGLPTPPLMETDTEDGFLIKVTLPESAVPLTEQRKWLGDVQSAIVAADKKFRSLASAQIAR